MLTEIQKPFWWHANSKLNTRGNILKLQKKIELFPDWCKVLNDFFGSTFIWQAMEPRLSVYGCLWYGSMLNVSTPQWWLLRPALLDLLLVCRCRSCWDP